MTRPPHHKTNPHLTPEFDSERGVVRAAKAIPVMERQQRDPEPQAGLQGSCCTGHCGHCDVHPCQLHTSV